MLTLKQSRRLRNALLGLLCWGIALLLFFPIFWMLLTSFKSEIDAFATPPQFIFQPTLENYLHINERSDYFAYAWNSLLISSSATLLCMLVAVPAAYSMAFFETRHTKRTLLWMLSTKMLPPVGVLMPIYLLAKQFGLLDLAAGADHRLHPDQPADRGLDGVHLLQRHPRGHPRSSAPGRRRHPAGDRPRTAADRPRRLASTLLLSLILCWNEAFWSLNLTSSAAAPLTALVASYSSPEGLFWAKLSAVSTLACAPILVFGWISQKQLVRGLSFGAVK